LREVHARKGDTLCHPAQLSGMSIASPAFDVRCGVSHAKATVSIDA
jgi:hypothetical protein